MRDHFFDSRVAYLDATGSSAFARTRCRIGASAVANRASREGVSTFHRWQASIARPYDQVFSESVLGSWHEATVLA